MTRRDAFVRLTRVLAGVCLGLGLSASVHAAPIDGGVVWAFEGTVSNLTGDYSACCVLAWNLGGPVTGALTFAGPPGAAYMTRGSAQIDVPGGAPVIFGEDGHSFYDGDGTPGSPDQASFAGPAFGPTATLQPGWSTGPFQPYASLFLVDDDGTAWSGINPRTGFIFPDDAPDASLFERAEILLQYQVGGPNGEIGGGLITIHIDRFPVPEPSAAALALAALAGLAPIRSSAGRSPRSRRALARRSPGGRVTRG